MIGTSCKDNEDVYNGEYTYYLSIQSEVMLHLSDNAEDESGMVNPVFDRLSRTVYFMKVMNGKGRLRCSRLVTACIGTMPKQIQRIKVMSSASSS